MNKKNEYDNKYIKEHYKTFAYRAKLDTAEEIKKYCDDFNISVNSFINMCCKYCMNNVHIDNLKHYK